MIPFLIWLVEIELLGLAAFPLAAAALPRLADRGYGLAKVVGLLLVTYLNYLCGSLEVANNPYLLAAGMATVLVIGAYALGLTPDAAARARAWFWEHRSVIVVEDGLFIAFFIVWALVRAAHPGILSTEKPMDLALMTATHRATAFPPYDPWLSGTTINYYYGGYLAIGTLVTLSGAAPAIGYNLGVALLFALVGTAAYSLAYTLTRSLRWAALGAIFVLLVGNLDGLGQFLQHGTAQVNLFDFFHSSRIVENGNTITEFPAFSFLLGDLHPHVIALPFTMLAIGVALDVAQARRAGWSGLAPTTPRRVLVMALAGIAIGALYFMNSWDWPTYLLLLGAAFVVPALPALNGRLLGEAVGLAVGVLALSYVLYLSFRLDFKPQYSSFGLLAHGSPTGQVLIMFGLFLLPIAAYIVTLLSQTEHVAVAATDIPGRTTTAVPASARERGRRPPTTRPPHAVTAVLERETANQDEDDGDDLPRLPLPSLPNLGAGSGGAVILPVLALVAWLLFGAVARMGTVGLLLPFFGAALYRAWREARQARALSAFALLLCAGGIGLIMLCDLFYLKDNFCGSIVAGNCTGDLYRMNTVFKFYYQAWTVLALGASYGLYALARRLREGWARMVAPAAAALALAGGVYLALGLLTPTTNSYTLPVANAAPTLDGSAYVNSYSGPPITATNAIPADAPAIAWLRTHVSGHPTILEANQVPGPPPRPQEYWPYPGDPLQELMMSRIATFTGLPTVLGWGYSHEGLWHGDAIVAQRYADVTALYTSSDPATVERLLRGYRVGYIYLGQVERATYYDNSQERVSAALARFRGFGRVVYTANGVTIIRTPYAPS